MTRLTLPDEPHAEAEKNPWQHPWLPAVTAIAVALIGLLGLLVTRDPRPPPIPCDLGSGSGPRGCIEAPQTGDDVERSFTVVGSLADVPAGAHVLLATEVDNLYWPKEPEVAAGPAFSVTVVEGGRPPGGTFNLTLLLVDDETLRQIEDWTDKDERPGLPLGSMTVLDAVTDLHLR